MGAATSAERAGKSEEDATTNEEQSEAVDDEIQEGDEADAKIVSSLLVPSNPVHLANRKAYDSTQGAFPLAVWCGNSGTSCQGAARSAASVTVDIMKTNFIH
ncbi:hypothetical protein EOD39_4425 [Acipenser ruthenus]|uniref:Uncharacterized protein n=1 Tax=Acipenser ruthenus TaxID=7906 RepID=A0A444UIF4_ACIRT|nr:hypothetical protein EOD39_4425 [Acipenser ruthenus]